MVVKGHLIYSKKIKEPLHIEKELQIEMMLYAKSLKGMSC